jgi:hypothetical protein
MLKILEMGLVVGVISVTITKSSLFESLRDWMWEKSGNFLGKLFSCPYCMSHWVALVMVIWGNPGLIVHPYELVKEIFCVIGVAMVAGWVVYRSYMGIAEVGKMRDELEGLRGENESLREGLERAGSILRSMRDKEP